MEPEIWLLDNKNLFTVLSEEIQLGRVPENSFASILKYWIEVNAQNWVGIVPAKQLLEISKLVKPVNVENCEGNDVVVILFDLILINFNDGGRVVKLERIVGKNKLFWRFIEFRADNELKSEGSEVILLKLRSKFFNFCNLFNQLGTTPESEFESNDKEVNFVIDCKNDGKEFKDVEVSWSETKLDINITWEGIIPFNKLGPKISVDNPVIEDIVLGTKVILFEWNWKTFKPVRQPIVEGNEPEKELLFKYKLVNDVNEPIDDVIVPWIWLPLKSNTIIDDNEPIVVGIFPFKLVGPILR